uniref:Hedgehog protein Hint domain-containing protein n=1 Tax=Rhodosorus marinus TaxID=101924 RepID=A0A7S3EPS4_9RHOD|mmetsp:Transcript_8279/g.36988  ORF Transcript_8279/g.36988 Transcript_8279/m.36988 type:complete len:536 (+) Transcript_8279:285-1892(+)
MGTWKVIFLVLGIVLTRSEAVFEKVIEIGPESFDGISNELCCSRMLILYDQMATISSVKIVASSEDEVNKVDATISDGNLRLLQLDQPSESVFVQVSLVLGTPIAEISIGSRSEAYVVGLLGSPIGSIVAMGESLVRNCSIWTTVYVGAVSRYSHEESQLWNHQVHLGGSIYPLDFGFRVRTENNAAVCVDAILCGDDQCAGTADLVTKDNGAVVVRGGRFPVLTTNIAGPGFISTCPLTVVRGQAIVSGSDENENGGSVDMCVTEVLESDITDGGSVTYDTACAADDFELFARGAENTPVVGCSQPSTAACNVIFTPDTGQVIEECPSDTDCRIVCFSKASTVNTLQGSDVIPKRLFEVRVGDLVQSYDLDGGQTFSEVFLVQHEGPEGKAVPMNKLHYETMADEGDKLEALTVSALHYILSSIVPKMEYTKVSDLKVGSRIFILDSAGKYQSATIIKFEYVHSPAVNIHTLNDRIVVDGVLASSIASLKLFGVVDTMQLRLMLLPLKVLYLLGASRLVQVLDSLGHRVVKQFL